MFPSAFAEVFRVAEKTCNTGLLKTKRKEPAQPLLDLAILPGHLPDLSLQQHGQLKTKQKQLGESRFLHSEVTCEVQVLDLLVTPLKIFEFEIQTVDNFFPSCNACLIT